jgi:23S rRNA U2552 (ribose-2'-O)-methylase RlmE/FtsJ
MHNVDADAVNLFNELAKSTAFDMQTVDLETGRKMFDKLKSTLFVDNEYMYVYDIKKTIDVVGADLREVKQSLMDEINADFTTVDGKRQKIFGSLKVNDEEGMSYKWELKREFAKRDFDSHITFGFTKLYEILWEFGIIKLAKTSKLRRVNTFHICEIPGGFVMATNYLLKIQAPDKEFNWGAQSLNPWMKHEGMRPLRDQYGLVRKYAKRYHFGPKNTGDIMDPENIKFYTNKFHSMDLVTADCAFEYNITDFDQETRSIRLYLAQMIVALGTLGNGGTYIFKIFTYTNPINVAFFYILYCLFDQLKIVKPATSKSGSTEVYVICIGFRGQKYSNIVRGALMNYYGKLANTRDSPAPIIPIEKLPGEFVHRVALSQQYFANRTILFMRLRRLEVKFGNKLEGIERRKKDVDKFIEGYIKHYGYAKISKNERLL